MAVTAGQFHHTAAITDLGTAGLQGVTATLRKLEHQFQPDGNTLLPKDEDGQILHCTVTPALEAMAAAVGEGQSQSPLLIATALQVQEKKVNSAAIICRSKKIAWSAYKLKMVCVKSCQKLWLPQG